jgi:hypothetical protein
LRACAVTAEEMILENQENNRMPDAVKLKEGAVDLPGFFENSGKTPPSVIYWA